MNNKHTNQNTNKNTEKKAPLANRPQPVGPVGPISEEPKTLDARASLDIPLASFLKPEPEEEVVTTMPTHRPGLSQERRPPSMPDPEHVSRLPESENEKLYMVQEMHKPAGPHIVIDTPIPTEIPSIDTLGYDMQPTKPGRYDVDESTQAFFHTSNEATNESTSYLAAEYAGYQSGSTMEAVTEQKEYPTNYERAARQEAGSGQEPRSSREHHSARLATAGTLLEVVGLEKSYRKASITIPVLRGVNLSVKTGQFVSIVGQSGSGKSTLLHLIGTLDAPDAGQIHFRGYRIDNLSSRRRDMLRNDRFGMIFQSYHLLPELNVLENVLSPLLIRESVPGYFLRRRAHRRRAIELIEAVGLGHRLKHRPKELSGGEMQRTAIARALISQPELLLADEPTGNLDHETGMEIIELLGRLNREQNLTILMVTHDQTLAQRADEIIGLVDGRVVTTR